MDRRQFNSIGVAALGVGLGAGGTVARALTLEDLSPADAVRGLTAALERGARSAVSQLGRPNGFLANDKVRIRLPKQLQDAEPLLRRFGQGAPLDELITSMNRAAEEAVVLAKELLLAAVRGMSVADAKGILAGGENSVTEFFASKTRAPLERKFLPVVTRVTGKVALATQYNHVVAKAADVGLLRREGATVEEHVTAGALDGMYLMIGEEERKIRRDPAGTGSALLGKVFGALK